LGPSRVRAEARTEEVRDEACSLNFACIDNGGFYVADPGRARGGVTQGTSTATEGEGFVGQVRESDPPQYHRSEVDRRAPIRLEGRTVERVESTVVTRIGFPMVGSERVVWGLWYPSISSMSKSESKGRLPYQSSYTDTARLFLHRGELQDSPERLRWRLSKRDILKCKMSLGCMASVGELFEDLDAFIGDQRDWLKGVSDGDIR